MHFRYFLAVFELLSDSLTAIYVELHQCPSHHSILLTQGRIWEIFAKNFWELAILKNELFLSRPFWIFFRKKNFFFASFPWKSAQIYMVEWMDEILMFSLVSRKFLAMRNIVLYSVPNQMLYYISLFGKIRSSLIYLPT